MVSQEDKELLRQEIMEDNYNADRLDCDLQDLECFTDYYKDVILTTVKEVENLKKLFDKYGHEFNPNDYS